MKYFPKHTDMIAVEKTGKTLMYCEVESNHPFELKLFKDGKEVSPDTKPPFQFSFADRSGKTIVQWPYAKNRSRGTYECRASNGIDPDVSHKVKFTPVKSKFFVMLY